MSSVALATEIIYDEEVDQLGASESQTEFMSEGQKSSSPPFRCMFRLPKSAVLTVALLVTLLLLVVSLVIVSNGTARESIENFSTMNTELYDSDSKVRFKAAAIDALLAALNLRGPTRESHDDTMLQAAKAIAVDTIIAAVEKLKTSPVASGLDSHQSAKATIVNAILAQLGLEMMRTKSDDTAAQAIAADTIFAAFKNSQMSYVRSDRASTQDYEDDVLPNPSKLLYIACLSAPEDHRKRMQIRGAWMDRLRHEHGYDVQAEFVVGHKTMAGEKWCMASKADQILETNLQEESKTYGDIARVALPEASVNLPDKAFQAFELGVDERYKFIMRIDDDMDLDYAALIEHLKSESPVDGLHLDLFPNRSANAYLLNFGLAHMMTKVRRFENIGYLSHGSTAEDINIRNWAAREIQTDFRVWDSRPVIKKISHDLSVTPRSLTKMNSLAHTKQQELLSDPDKLLYIAVQSRPDGLLERTKARQTWLTQLRQQYGKEVQANFILGHKTMRSDHVPYDEQVIETMIETENKQYGDIKRIPLPESYANLPDKTFLSVRLGVDARYKFILKIDADVTLQHAPLINYLKAKDPEAGLYLECVTGFFFYDRPLMATQRGADGKFARYAPGPCYLLSSGLAHRITKVHASENLAYLGYGTTSEDVDMGKWVYRERNMEHGVRYELQEVAKAQANHIANHTSSFCHDSNEWCPDGTPRYCSQE